MKTEQVRIFRITTAQYQSTGDRLAIVIRTARRCRRVLTVTTSGRDDLEFIEFWATVPVPRAIVEAAK